MSNLSPRLQLTIAMIAMIAAIAAAVITAGPNWIRLWDERRTKKAAEPIMTGAPQQNTVYPRHRRWTLFFLLFDTLLVAGCGVGLVCLAFSKAPQTVGMGAIEAALAGGWVIGSLRGVLKF